MLKPPSLMPSETDTDDIKHSKRLALFSHMCQRRQRLCTTSKKKDYTWAIEASMGVEISSDQRTLFSPSATDVNVGNLMREVAIDSGVKKMATRKLNNLGEINPKCNMLNHPDRLVKMKNMLQLGASIESLTTITNKERTNKKQVLVGKLLEHVAHARLKLARFPTVTVASASKLKMTEVKAILMKDLHVPFEELRKKKTELVDQLVQVCENVFFILK